MEAPPIRVLVVDDHPVVRHGLLSLLRYEPGFEIAGDAADGETAVEAVLTHNPDVVLLDLRLPGLNGVEVMLHARDQGSKARFLVLTTYDSDHDIQRALAAGAKGYLLKDVTPTELIQAIRGVMHGKPALEPSVAARMMARIGDNPADELSAREIEVLQSMVHGDSNRAIALALHVSENTIKTHISHIFAKLGCQSRAEAVAIALQRKLVSYAH